MYRPNYTSPEGAGNGGQWASSGPSVVPGIGRGRDWDGGLGRQGVCNNWRREGRCSFGDRCKFIHDHPTGIETKSGNNVTDGEGIQPNAAMDGRMVDNAQRWRDGKEGGPKDYYKTKLCEKFAAMGRCPYDERCTYAHGYEELRPYPRSQNIAEAAHAAESTDPTNASETHSIASERMRPKESSSEGAFQQHQAQNAITYIDKVRAICSCLGIGTPSVKPGAVQEALTDVSSQSMLRGNVYADDTTTRPKVSFIAIEQKLSGSLLSIQSLQTIPAITFTCVFIIHQTTQTLLICESSMDSNLEIEENERSITSELLGHLLCRL